MLLGRLGGVRASGDTTTVPSLSLVSLLPDTGDYVTYEGSTTHPGCWESVGQPAMSSGLSKHSAALFILSI